MTDKDKKPVKDNDDLVKEAAEKIMQGPDDSGSQSSKAVGVDIGTSKIVLATKNNGKDMFGSQLNAFIAVDYSKFTRDILKQNKINHYKKGDSLIVYGDGAEVFANMMNKETRRPMRKGLLNPQETIATEVIKGIIDLLIESSGASRSQLCFSIPGAPKDSESDIIYHEAVIKRYLDSKGFSAKSINEGLSVVFSELEAENFTGFGVSAGGGMCNICLAYLSIPHISFSITKGGDYIDDAVASVTGEVNTRIRDFKEHKLDLTKKPRNDIEDALHIYYDDLIMTIVKAMRDSLTKTSKLPKEGKPIPIVLSGGSVKPKGFKEKFESVLNQDGFPVPISEVRIARDPLNATARGALIAAMYED